MLTRTRTLIDWAKLPGAPANLKMVGDITEENIVDQIEAARTESAFVIVDLEGTASLMVSYAISLANLVIVPMQGSQLDAKQAARRIKLIQAQGRIAGRTIPFTMLLTRTHPAISPRTQRHIEQRFAELQVPLLNTRLADREAYRAMFSYGGTLRSGLAGRHVSNLDLAIKNARLFAGEGAQAVARRQSDQRGGGRMSTDRADPFALDVSGFAPRHKNAAVAPAG